MSNYYIGNNFIMKETLDKYLDLSILEGVPCLNREIILEIQPLAPLSMTGDLPGSYFKTLKSPSKKMLCGLFENVLDWHIDAADRKEIISEIKKIRKSQKLEFPEEGGSSYSPFLMEYFEISLTMIPPLINYDDYWSKAFRRADAIVHPKGTFNLSYNLIAQKRELTRNEKKQSQVDDKSLADFFKTKKDEYPLYYSSPTSREYLVANGKYVFKLLVDTALYELLKERLLVSNMAYLGNSEGWVDLKMNEL